LIVASSKTNPPRIDTDKTGISVRPARRSTKSSATVVGRHPSQFVRVASKTFPLLTMATGLLTDEAALDLSAKRSGMPHDPR
jgi:hypothetical protein